MSQYKRLQTQLDGKMSPVLRVAYMDGNDCSGQSFCIHTIPGGHSKQREHAYRDVGSRATQGVVAEDALSFARYSFGTTKHRASRLAYRDVGKQRKNGCGSFDWNLFRGNRNTKLVLTGPRGFNQRIISLCAQCLIQYPGFFLNNRK